MSAKTHYFRIGLFILVGALLFIGALFAVGLRSYFGQKDVYETCVDGKVENLSVGALVMLRGVAVGHVSAIEFAGKEYGGMKQQFVIVQFEIPKGTLWSEGSGDVQRQIDDEAAKGLRARVQGQGFLGANIVALEYVDPLMYPIEPIPWKPKHYYIPSAPNQFNHVFSSLEKTLGRVGDVDITNLLARVDGLIDRVNRLVGHADELDFKQIGTNANALIVEFRETNRGLQKTLDDARAALTNAQGAITGADLPAISKETLALEARLSNTALELKRTLANVDMGALNSSLANIRAATDELILLLDKLQQRPSAVLFSKPPPPAPQLEKPPRP